MRVDPVRGMMRMGPAFAFVLVLLLAAGCVESEREGGTLELERTQVGDTTIVRSTGGSVWGDSVRLVETLSIGELEGPPEYQFGQVQDLAVDAEGGVYVFDGHVPAIRYYDASGSYVRTVGGEGQGPGEYRDASLGMAVRRSDGRLVMRDPRNMRMNVYEPDGSPSESWRIESGLFTGRATTVDTAGHMYLKILTGPIERNEPWPIGLLHMDDTGEIVDTLEVPELPADPDEPGGTFGVQKEWAVSPLGGIVAGVSDRYVLHHVRPDGTVLRIERDAEPAPVHPDERAEHEARLDWRWERQGQTITADRVPVPEVKPIFRGIYVGDQGRIWVHRYVEAVKDPSIEKRDDPDARPVVTWREPVVFDVFEADGRFLGTVRVPPRTSLRVYRGDRVWGVRRGEFDEAYVVGFRIDHE